MNRWTTPFYRHLSLNPLNSADAARSGAAAARRMKFLSRFKRKNQLDLPEESGPNPGGPSDPVPDIANGGEHPKPAASDEICLRLGDFLHRIPAHLLQTGPHDLQKEVRFPIN